METENPVIVSLYKRRSVRAFSDEPISDTDRELIIDAAIQAPTAGNQNLYTILEIRDQSIKNELAITCDNQPFIARAPLVLMFLAGTDAVIAAQNASRNCLSSTST